jgi:hypothetical protein
MMGYVEHQLRRRPRQSAISLDFDDCPSVPGPSGVRGRRDAAATPPTLSAQWRSVLAEPDDIASTAMAGPPVAQHEVPRTERMGPEARVARSSPAGHAVTVPETAPTKSGVARLLRVRAEERSWLIAAAGEEGTADRLDRLALVDPRWRFLHGVRQGGRVPDIDHLAIGPGGVFIITSKHHPRASVWVRRNVLVVNGEKQSYVRAARHSARQAATALSALARFEVAVLAVVALVDARELTVETALPDVSVLHQRAVVRWLLRQPEVLDGASVDSLDEIARRPSIWGTAQSWR